MLRRFVGIASCLILIWVISLERTYAWLALQSEQYDRFAALGLSPLGFDFTRGDLGDVRWQLIGQRGVGAEVVAAFDGLHVQPVRPGFELRLNLAGAQLQTKSVDALVLQMRPEQEYQPLPQFSLAVHAGANDPGWIAELHANFDPNNVATIDLNALIFKQEPARTRSTRWRDLPLLTHLRLYGGDVDKPPFIVQTIGFRISLAEPATRQTSLAEPATRQTSLAEPATRQTSLAEPATRQTSLAEQATRQTSLAEQATRQTSLAEQATRQTSLAEPATRQTSLAEQATRQTSLAEQATRQISLAEQATRQTSLAEQATRQISLAEPATD
jgi:hypothetical protein